MYKVDVLINSKKNGYTVLLDYNVRESNFESLVFPNLCSSSHCFKYNSLHLKSVFSRCEKTFTKCKELLKTIETCLTDASYWTKANTDYESCWNSDTITQ